MKILFLANSLQGLYSFRRELVEEFRRRNYSVYISTPATPQNLVDFFKGLGCEIIDTSIDRRGINPVKDLSLMRFYSKIISKISPDVVLSYTIKPNLYGGLMCRVKRVAQIANVTGLGTAVENGGVLQKFTIFLYKLCLKRCGMTFFQNDENRGFCLKKKMVNKNNALIPGSGVNLSRFEFSEMKEGDEGEVRFIFISRLMPQKGINQYLGMARIIKERYPNTEFHILGDCDAGYNQDNLNECVKDKIVFYHGRTSDVVPFIRDVHCTIHPTYYPEGMSNVLLESCAMGRAIITTDRSGCREIVDDGVNGYIVRAKDVDNLVEKVERFINLPADQKRAMGIAARDKMEREFDRNIVIGRYLETIDRLTQK